MGASPECNAVMIDLSELTRRDEVYAYATEHKLSWKHAIVRLINQALSDGPNPQYSALRSCAEVNGISEDEAYALIWGATCDECGPLEGDLHAPTCSVVASQCRIDGVTS